MAGKYMNPRIGTPRAPVPQRPSSATPDEYMGSRPLRDEAANPNRSKRAAGMKKGGKMPLPKPKPPYNARPNHPMNKEQTKGMAGGGKLKMVEKGGKKVPFYAADGVGKMASGGPVKVKSGDTLSQIAKSKGVTLKALLAANPNIKNANQIRVGQSIKIPGATAGAGAKSSNPYAGMTKTQMNMMDVKNKDRRKQRAATRGMQAQGKAGGQSTPTKTSKDPKLDELRSRIKRAASASKPAAKKQAPRSASGMRDDDVAAYKGGAMKKKVRAYKHGGAVCRGGGAATKGKRFGRAG